MKRTQQEILNRIEEIEDDDFFGHQRGDLIEYLDFENAKKFLKDGTTAEQWNEYQKEVLPPREKMIDYLAFAWEKAYGERGLSAARSMDHYTSWLWLDGDEELHKTLAFYTDYGKPQLEDICRYLGVDPAQYAE